MKNLLGFQKGGVHPDDKKALSKAGAITAVECPKLVTVPLAQHIGAPAKLIVKKGDEVLAGQLLAEAGGFVSAPVHSPVSGKIKKTSEVATSGGYRMPAIEIINDGNYTWAEGIEPEATHIDFDQSESFLELIRDAGVVGMGGAAFPTHVKLSPPEDATIDHLIINGAECEPYLTADYRMMLEYPEEIIQGIKAMMMVLGVDKAILGIEDNKVDAWQAMNELAP